MTIHQISELLEASYWEAFHGNVEKPIFNVILPASAYHLLMKELIEKYGGGALRKPEDFIMPMAKDKLGYLIDSNKKWHTTVDLGYYELRVSEGDIFSAQLVNKPVSVQKMVVGLWEQMTEKPFSKPYRSQCTCACHGNLTMMHIVPCCYPDPPATTLTPEQKKFIHNTSDEGYYGGPECPNSWQLGYRHKDTDTNNSQ